jgi:hypothetical protein
MIQNIQCSNAFQFRSIFALDSEFIQIQFTGENIEPMYVIKKDYLISIIQQIQTHHSKTIHYKGDPFQTITSNQIIKIRF